MASGWSGPPPPSWRLSPTRSTNLRRDLISNFAHELRTPLTNLKGYLQALRDGVMPTSTEVFTSLDQEVDRLYRLSLSLDELGTGGSPKAPSGLGTIDLGQVVQAA